ncbi:MAG TPA: hypothetical protein VFY78_01565, partial [Gammaproteobacteria bacterium]|nr:hypothetical protein [Gammaproteobacteria bacterium]
MKRLLFILYCICCAIDLTAQQTTINGPAGSNQFGRFITVLTNGNYVIADPLYSEAGRGNCGAVYLYDGSTHALISTLKGNVAGDLVSSAGVFALPNGNFVVCSPFCNNGSVSDAGAVTWCNGTTGLSGVVDLSNSLMGSTFLDFVGQFGVTVLPSGNYVVNSRDWNNGSVADAGAVTWCNGNGGTVGVISSSNSLVGSSFSDQVGGTSITVLPNGNYLVVSGTWDNGAVSNVGAVTWCNGLTGRAGVLSNSNSLLGSAEFDLVGNGGIIILANGNYLVLSPSCDNGPISSAGAVTWGSGTTGITGVVSSSNSLMGGTASDRLGNFGVTLLSNGNYLTECPFCDIGGIT